MRWVVLLIILLLVGCTVKVTDDNTGGELQKIKLRMSWSPYTPFAPFVLAQDKGYYGEQGLEVEILPSQGSSEAVKIISSGTEEFGMASANTVLTGITKEMPLMVIMALIPETPSCLLYHKDSGIQTPKDFEGKKISSDPKSTKRQELIAFLGKNNVDIETVEFVPASGTTGELMNLINGNADASVAYCYLGEPILEKKKFTDFESMMFMDNGLSIYSQTLIIHKDLIDNYPELIKRFVAASRKGWVYSIEKPDEAVDSLVNRYPEMDREEEMAKFKKFIEILGESNNFGFMTDEGWKEAQDMLYEQGIIENRIEISSIYTNTFLGDNLLKFSI